MKSFRVFVSEDSTIPQTVVLPALYLDMDETIVDWISGADQALARANKPGWNDPFWDKMFGDKADEVRWEILNSTPNFWENLTFTEDGKKIWSFVKKYKPNILSACGSLTKNCKEGKRRWLVKHLGLSNLGKIHFVRRSQKKDFASVRGKASVLIDDYTINCQEFRTAGGIAIQVTSAAAVIAKLKALGFA